MVHVRLTLEEQGRASALPKVKFRERMRMLAAIDKRVGEALESSHQQIQDLEKAPPPQKLEQYDDRLHIFDRTRRKLNAARRWASFGVGLAEKISDRVRKKLKPSQRELVEARPYEQDDSRSPSPHGADQCAGVPAAVAAGVHSEHSRR